jgi:ferric-dicitrate binding protein FerR (iron transport regulator)
MLDDLIENFRERTEPRWDDLRERRLVLDLDRTLEQRASRRKARGRTLVIAIPVLLTSLSVAALVVAYVVGVDFGKKSAMRGSPPAQFGATSSQAAPSPSSGTSEIAETRLLADGSRLELSRTARVEVRSVSKERVELAQNDGRVRYQVTRIPRRAFVVFARGVQVQVKGTVFVVDVEGGKVSVQVQQGIVRVAARSGEVDLGVGDELSTPADQETPAGDNAYGAPSAPDGAAPPRALRSEAASGPSVSALLDRADAERRSGDLVSAAATLREPRSLGSPSERSSAPATEPRRGRRPFKPVFRWLPKVP